MTLISATSEVKIAIVVCFDLTLLQQGASESPLWTSAFKLLTSIGRVAYCSTVWRLCKPVLSYLRGFKAYSVLFCGFRKHNLAVWGGKGYAKSVSWLWKLGFRPYLSELLHTPAGLRVPLDFVNSDWSQPVTGKGKISWAEVPVLQFYASNRFLGYKIYNVKPLKSSFAMTKVALKVCKTQRIRIVTFAAIVSL